MKTKVLHLIAILLLTLFHHATLAATHLGTIDVGAMVPTLNVFNFARTGKILSGTKTMGVLTIECNAINGFTVSISSLNGGLKHDSTATLLPYAVYVNLSSGEKGNSSYITEIGSSAALTSSSISSPNVQTLIQSGALKRAADAVWTVESVMSNTAISGALAGTYTDTITVSFQSD